jgi:hypothetical protein
MGFKLKLTIVFVHALVFYTDASAISNSKQSGTEPDPEPELEPEPNTTVTVRFGDSWGSAKKR